MLPRSCNKPLQALAMVRAGLDLPPELLALACASHSGEPFHLDGVRRILAGAGLDESALQTPPDLPADDEARATALRRERALARMLMNCSGKHAAMLATCVVNGWDTATYLDPDHPLQQGILRRPSPSTPGSRPRSRGRRVRCAAALRALTGLAAAFRRSRWACAHAQRAPSRRGSPRRSAAPGPRVGHHARRAALLARGAGSRSPRPAPRRCYAVALPDGRAWALKIDDGGGACPGPS